MLISNHILRLISKSPRHLPKARNYSTQDEQQQRMSDLFSLEQKRQQEQIGRIEKIEVRYLGTPSDTTLIMNKGLSTPYNCAQHLSEGHCAKTALALIDSNIPWDMHRPLKDSCTLQLINFTVTDPHIVNRAFWRTCSFMLGAALHAAFKEDAQLLLHSFPSPNIKSGSFVHDISLSQSNWQPNKEEMRTLSAEMRKLANKDLKIERLDVDHEMALEIFRANPFKREQLPSIANQNAGKVTIYRMGNHVDISRGPMISSSSLLGKCTISAVHEVSEKDETTALYRVQGVALPVGFTMNHVAYGILEERSRKLNRARLPNEPYEENPSHIELAA